MMPTIDIKSNDVGNKNGIDVERVFNHITKMEPTLNDRNALILKDPVDIKIENGNFCLEKEISIDPFQSSCFGCQNLQKKLKISRGWNRFFKEKLLSYDKLLHIIGEYENEKKKNIELQLAYDQRSREWTHQQEQLITLYHEVQPLREKLKVAEATAEEEINLRTKHQYMEESLKVTIQQLQAKVAHMTTIANPVFVENLEKKLSTSRSEVKKLKCNLEFKRTEVEELRSYISNKHIQVENLSKKLLWALQLANKYGTDAATENTVEWETLQIQTQNILEGLKAQFNSFCETKRRELKGRRVELACLPSFSKWVTDFEVCDLTKKSSPEVLETRVDQKENPEKIQEEVNHLEKLLAEVNVEEVFMNMSKAEFNISSEELTRPVPESKSFSELLQTKRALQNIKREKTDKTENTKVSKSPQIKQKATSSENNNSKSFVSTSVSDKAPIKTEKSLPKNTDQVNSELAQKSSYDIEALNKMNSSSLPPASSSFAKSIAPTLLSNSSLSMSSSIKSPRRRSKKSTKENRKIAVNQDSPPVNENIHIFKNLMNKSLDVSSQRISSSKETVAVTSSTVKKRRKIVSSELVLSDSSSDTDSDDVPLSKVKNLLVGVDTNQKLESNFRKSEADKEKLSIDKPSHSLGTPSDLPAVKDEETRENDMEKIKQIMEVFNVPPLSHSPYSESTDSSSEVGERAASRKPIIIKIIEKPKRKSQIPEINEENSFVPNRITRASRYRQKETDDLLSSEAAEEDMHFLGLRRKVSKSRISPDTESSSEKKDEMQLPASTRKRNTLPDMDSNQEMPCPISTRRKIKSGTSVDIDSSSESTKRRTRAGIPDKEASLEKIESFISSRKRTKSEISSDAETGSEEKQAPHSSVSIRKRNKSEISFIMESNSVKTEMQLPIIKRRRTRSGISFDTELSLEEENIQSSASLKGKTKTGRYSITDSGNTVETVSTRTRNRTMSGKSIDTELIMKAEEQQPVSSRKRTRSEISDSAESSCIALSTNRRHSLRNTRTRSISGNSENIVEDTQHSKEDLSSVSDHKCEFNSDVIITSSEKEIQICSSEVIKTGVKNSKTRNVDVVHSIQYLMETDHLNDIDVADDIEKSNLANEKKKEISVSTEICSTNTDDAHDIDIPTDKGQDTEKPNSDNDKKIEISSIQTYNSLDMDKVNDKKNPSSDIEKILENRVSFTTYINDEFGMNAEHRVISSDLSFELPSEEKASEISLLGLNLSDDSFEDKDEVDSDADSALSTSLSNDVNSLKIISSVDSSVKNESPSSPNACDSGIFLDHSCDKSQRNDISRDVTVTEIFNSNSKEIMEDTTKSIPVIKEINEIVVQETKGLRNDAIFLEPFEPECLLRVNGSGSALADNLHPQTKRVDEGAFKMESKVIENNETLGTIGCKLEDFKELSNKEIFETSTKEPNETKSSLQKAANKPDNFSNNLIQSSQCNAITTPSKESVSSSDFSLVLSDSAVSDDSESESESKPKVHKTTSNIKVKSKTPSSSDDEESSLIMDIDDEMHSKLESGSNSCDSENELDSDKANVSSSTDFLSLKSHEVNNSGLTVESSASASSELNISESDLSAFAFYKERKDVLEQNGFEIPNIIFDESSADAKGVPSVEPSKKSKKKRKLEQLQQDEQTRKEQISSQEPLFCLPQIRSHSDFQNLPITLEDNEMKSEELYKCFEDIIFCNFRSQEWNFLVNKICSHIENTKAPDLLSKLQPLTRVLLISVLRSSPFEIRDPRFSVPPTIYKLFQIVRIIELNFRFPPFTLDSLVNVAAHKLILKKKLRPHSLMSLTTWVISSCYAQYNKLEGPLDEECVRWGRGFLIDLLFYHKDLVSESLLAAINSSRKIFVRIVKYRDSTVLEKLIFWIVHYGSWSGPKSTKMKLIEAFKHKLGLHNPPPEYPSVLLKSILLVLINAEADVDELTSTKAGFLLLLKWVPSSWIIKTLFPTLKEVFYDDVTINKHSLEYVKELFDFMVKTVQWSEEEESLFLNSLKYFPIIKS